MSYPNENREQDTRFIQLLNDARAGDEMATQELWEQFRSYMLKIANQDLRPALLQKFGASDIVQQSMLIANQKLPQFKGNTKGEFMAWMRQIVTLEGNQTRRRFQETEKRAVHLERSMDDSINSTRPASLQVSDPHLTPSTEAANDEQAAIVRRALLQLSPLDRQAIQLRNWEELSFEEVGNRIGKSSEAARKIWVRAIAKLELELKRMNAI